MAVVNCRTLSLMPHPTRLPSIVTRREFLRQGGSVAALVLAGPLTVRAREEKLPPALVGSNVYGWTQFAKREGWAFDIETVLSALRDCGYDYLEATLNLAQPEENARFAEQSRAKGLKPVSLYVGAPFHEPALAEQSVEKIVAAAAVCRRAGFSVIVCNADPLKGASREKTDAELAVQTAALERLGRELQRLGLKLALHDHLPGLASGARELRANFDRTDPQAVGFCYDVHWLWRGGIQPPEALAAYGSRLVTWHLRQSRDNLWLEELSDGDIDYRWIARYAAEHRLPRLFEVELALAPNTRLTRSAIENHRRSRDYVRQVFGV